MQQHIISWVKLTQLTFSISEWTMFGSELVAYSRVLDEKSANNTDGSSESETKQQSRGPKKQS